MLNSECLEIFNKYLTEVKKCSQNTLSSYLRDIRQLSEYMEAHVDDSLDKVTEEELSDYISWLKGNGKSVATVSRAIASVKCFYGLLVTEGYIEERQLRSFRRFSQARKSSFCLSSPRAPMQRATVTEQCSSFSMQRASGSVSLSHLISMMSTPLPASSAVQARTRSVLSRSIRLRSRHFQSILSLFARR